MAVSGVKMHVYYAVRQDNSLIRN